MEARAGEATNLKTKRLLTLLFKKLPELHCNKFSIRYLGRYTWYGPGLRYGDQSGSTAHISTHGQKENRAVLRSHYSAAVSVYKT
jgi:hypothetical protein